MEPERLTPPQLVLEHAEGWLLYAVVGLAVVAAWWAWRRYGPPPPGRRGFIAKTCRALALVGLVILAAGPAYRSEQRSAVPGTVLLAIDDSASMGREDGPGGARRSDLAEPLRQALRARFPQDTRLILRRIGGVAADPGDPPEFLASGTSSPLGDELLDLILNGRPDIAVVLSDGRRTDGSELAVAARRLAERNLPRGGLWPVAIGSMDPVPELRIDEILSGRELAAGERSTLRARIAYRSLPAGPVTVRVRHGDELLASADLTLDGESGSVDVPLVVTLAEEGSPRLRIEVLGPNGLESSLDLPVTVRARTLRVLLLAHRPRPDLRYLREALRRDATVTVHSYLADARWRRWGDANWGPEITPLSPAELRSYDTIILGDLPAEMITQPMAEGLVTAVREHGSGVLWIPGESGAVAGLATTPLGALLPVQLPSATEIVRGYRDEITRQLVPTEAAQSLDLLDPGDGEWSELPRLRGACPILGIQPGALVLAEDQDGRALVVQRAYRSGTVIFVGIDDTWRWRRLAGDTWLNRFHSPLIRAAAAGRLLGRDPWRLTATPSRATPGTPIELGLIPVGPVAEELPPRISVRLGGAGRERIVELTRVGTEAAYRAVIPAPSPGAWVLSLADGGWITGASEAELAIRAPEAETADPRADREAMASMARLGGGDVLLLDQQQTGAEADASLRAFLARLPEPGEVRVDVSLDPLRGRWWVLLVLVGLLAVDWAIRRHSRLP